MDTLGAWTPALIPALLAVIALWGPGLVITWALGVSRWRQVAFAPLASAGVIGLAAVAGPFLGLDWGWGLYLLATGVVALLALFCSLFVNHWRRRRTNQSEGPRTTQPIPAEPNLWPAFVGTLVTLPFTVAAYIKGIVRPEYPTQTWDGVFHLSAVRWIRDTGNGSTLNLNAVATDLAEAEASKGSFYPAGFHDLVSLTVTDNIIVATNAVVIVIGTLLWPLGVALLSSIFVPKSKALPIFTALLAATFTSFPERPSSYGVLWPVVYSYALVPLMVIVLADWFGRTNQKLMGVRTTYIGLLGIAGIGIAHPTGVFVALIATVVLIIDMIVRLIARTLRITKFQGGLLVVLIAALVGALWFIAQQPVWAGVTTWEREPIGSFLRESFGVIFESQLSWMGYGDAYIDWALGILTLIGAVVALWMPRTRWLLFTYGVGSYLFVASAVVDLPGYILVAPWYSDPVRLGAIVPLFGAPIAGLGAWWIYKAVIKLVDRGAAKKQFTANKRHAARQPDTVKKRTAAKRSFETGTLVLFVIGLIFGTNYLGYYAASSQLHLNYEFKNESGLNGLVSPDELKFIETLPNYVEKGDVILGDPRTGAPFIYILTGLDVTHRHLNGWWGEDYWALGQRFNKAAGSDHNMCEVLKRNNIRYFYTDEIIYWPENNVGNKYVGLEEAREVADAFTPVASGGGATLYEITTCPHVQELNAQESGSD